MITPTSDAWRYFVYWLFGYMGLVAAASVAWDLVMKARHRHDKE